MPSGRQDLIRISASVGVQHVKQTSDVYGYWWGWRASSNKLAKLDLSGYGSVEDATGGAPGGGGVWCQTRQTHALLDERLKC